MRIVSNVGTDRVVDLIQPWLRPGQQIDLASQDFSLFAFGHAVFAQNAEDGANRRFILVQIAEPFHAEDSGQKAAVDFCSQVGKPSNIAELTKERLRRCAESIGAERGKQILDRGFRVLKLDTSNFRTWEPDEEDLERTLLDSVDHIKPDRGSEDLLFELLLKLGLDLCVSMETRRIAGKSVCSIGGGTLIVCLDGEIAREDVEALGLGTAEWHGELSPAGGSTVVFLDSAFVDDVAKSNLAAILEQRGLENVRSL